MRWSDVLLSRQSPMRPHVALTLMATMVYVVSWALCAYGVNLGLIEAFEGLVTIGLGAVYATLLYLAVRSGWSRRFKDPGLTKLQFFMGINFCALTYAIAGTMRTCVLSAVALTLTFGIFSLQPRVVRIMAFYAVSIMGATMLFMSLRHPQRYAPYQEAFDFAVLATIVPSISMLAERLNRLRGKLRQQRDELTRALKKIEELASLDELTGLYNRRYMMQQFDIQLKRSKRSGWPLAVALIDLDHFKQVNDTHGHAVGDEVLCSFAKCLGSVMRETDILARWGGEEFLLIFANTAVETAEQVLERMRQQLEQTQVCAHLPQLRVRFSAGVTQSKGTEKMEILLERADKALYLAKTAGRDCTQVMR